MKKTRMWTVALMMLWVCSCSEVGDEPLPEPAMEPTPAAQEPVANTPTPSPLPDLDNQPCDKLNERQCLEQSSRCYIERATFINPDTRCKRTAFFSCNRLDFLCDAVVTMFLGDDGSCVQSGEYCPPTPDGYSTAPHNQWTQTCLPSSQNVNELPACP